MLNPEEIEALSANLANKDLDAGDLGLEQRHRDYLVSLINQFAVSYSSSDDSDITVETKVKLSGIRPKPPPIK
jgi:hypothetical protein